MGNRGSKSVIFKSINFIVKEQRVNGSCFIKFIPLLDQRQELMKLRCTLLGNERSYQVKIPSNQIIQRRFYSIEPFAPACASLASVSRARAEELTQLTINIWLYLVVEPLTGFTDAEQLFHKYEIIVLI